MNLADFIARVSAEEYFFSGTYHEAARHALALPAEGVGRFLEDARALLFEGSCRHHRGTASHQFSVRIPLDIARMRTAEVMTVHAGALTGHFLPAGDGFELLAWGSNGNILSCGIQVDADASLVLSGSARIDGSSIAFRVVGHAGPDRESLGSVVRISGGRPA
jgi:hypothetical protein